MIQFIPTPLTGFLSSGWERIKEAVTPVSHAEALVNEIYSPENRGLAVVSGEARFEPESASTPQVFVGARQAVSSAITSTAAAIKSQFTKAATFGVIALVLLFIIWLVIRRAFPNG